MRTVLRLYEAIRDRKITDLLALVDPKVACFPVVRPGYSVYCGHDAMVKLIDYMHEVHGEYRLEIGKVTVREGPGAASPRVKVTAGPATAWMGQLRPCELPQGPSAGATGPSALCPPRLQ